MIEDPLVALAEQVAEPGTLEAVGARTRPHVEPARADRQIRSPSGVVAVEPADMTVRVRAGTPVAELAAAVGEHGQRTVLDGPEPERSTVGGALSAGHSSTRRLGDGPLRDAVLGLTWISAEGAVVKAGGATVKNVSGYDLCRLMVGSQGTLGVLAEVVLRTRPVPAISRWFTGPADPFALRQALHGPVAVLWDGTTTWLLLEGHAADVADQAAVAAAHGCGEEVGGPPAIPTGGRLSRAPALLGELAPGQHGGFVAEVGVGVVHTSDPVAPPVPRPTVVELCRRIKEQLDPTNRMAPGRRLW